MKYVLGIVGAPAIIISALFFGVPAANAVNPVDCAFNPAVAKAHPAECKGVTVEKVASNGGAKDTDGDHYSDGYDNAPDDPHSH